MGLLQLSLKNIKNGSQVTIHTFKNYFITIFSVLVAINSIQTDPKTSVWFLSCSNGPKLGLYFLLCFLRLHFQIDLLWQILRNIVFLFEFFYFLEYLHCSMSFLLGLGVLRAMYLVFEKIEEKKVMPRFKECIGFVKMLFFCFCN